MARCSLPSGERGVLGLRHAVQADVPIADVEIDERRVRLTEQLGHAALGDAAEELDLQGAILRHHVALDPHGIDQVRRVDVGAPEAVADDVHGRREVGDGKSLFYREIGAFAQGAEGEHVGTGVRASLPQPRAFAPASPARSRGRDQAEGRRRGMAESWPRRAAGSPKIRPDRADLPG
jgi:hypothetical protein